MGVWAQDDGDDASSAERLARKKFEEEQRLDEYANSLRRRDWLKDRLILQVGLGSKYPVMGKLGFGFGIGVEYITRYHIAPFASYGMVFEADDPSFADSIKLEGGAGYRVGLTYYFNPKSPLHIGVMASYGDVYYDHRAQADTIPNDRQSRQYLPCKGYELDITISYLTNEWYFLNFIAGAYYIGNKLPGTVNPGMEPDIFGVPRSVVTNDGDVDGIPDVGLVFGLGIGFAFPEFFPDDTEVRRRMREDKRSR